MTLRVAMFVRWSVHWGISDSLILNEFRWVIKCFFQSSSRDGNKFSFVWFDPGWNTVCQQTLNGFPWNFVMTCFWEDESYWLWESSDFSSYTKKQVDIQKQSRKPVDGCQHAIIISALHALLLMIHDSVVTLAFRSNRRCAWEQPPSC